MFINTNYKQKYLHFHHQLHCFMYKNANYTKYVIEERLATMNSYLFGQVASLTHEYYYHIHTHGIFLLFISEARIRGE